MPDVCLKTVAQNPCLPITMMLDISMSPHTEIQLYCLNL